MTAEIVQIKRYPNRRFYALGSSRYVCLADIEDLIREGRTVEIHDSQTGEDITRLVLTQLIIERHPEKIALFPSAMLHFMLRANDMVSSFLRDYFRNSLTYLEYLQQHGARMDGIAQPMHWMKAWFQPPARSGSQTQVTGPVDEVDEGQALAQRVRQLEERLQQLESGAPSDTQPGESQ